MYKRSYFQIKYKHEHVLISLKVVIKEPFKLDFNSYSLGSSQRVELDSFMGQRKFILKFPKSFLKMLILIALELHLV